MEDSVTLYFLTVAPLHARFKLPCLPELQDEIEKKLIALIYPWQLPENKVRGKK